MVRTAIQLQTFESLSEGLPTTIARIGETSLEGVEFAGLNRDAPTDIADALETTSLEPLGAHVSLATLETKYEDVIEAYDRIGCRRVIVADRDLDSFASAAGVERLADRMNHISARLVEDGFSLVYHNDMVEFGQIGDELAYDVFVDSLDETIALEVDTGLVQYAGVDPDDLMRRHADRISLLHLTDSAHGGSATINLELGAGELDVEACVETARSIDVEWIVYEHSMTSDPLDSLIHGESKLSMLCHGAANSSSIRTEHSTD